MAGLSDIQTAVGGLVKLYNAIDDMKVYKGQCRRLHASYTALLDTLCHNDETLYGTKYQVAIDEAEFNIERIAKRVDTWSKLSSVKSLFVLSDIKRGLEESHRDFVQCATRLNVISQMEGYRKTTEIERKVDGNYARVDERLQELVATINMFQQMHAETNRQDLPSQEILQTLQEQSFDVPSPPILRTPRTQRKQSNDVMKTEFLPQSVDLTGEVQILHNYPIDVSNGQIQAHCGEWAGKEVELNLIDCIRPNAKLRLMLEARRWQELNHENVAKIYGIATVGIHLYTVSPRVANDDVLTYLGNKSHADGLKVMVDVAMGLEYLHSNGIVHGDLLPTNVMISEGGVAYIINYGLFVILEEEAIEYQSAASDSLSSSRWLAPELIDPSLTGSQLGERNAATDVWSYGVLCREILGGQRPYHNRETAIRPTRRTLEGTLSGLSKGVLELINDCCRRDPKSRPTMNKIVQRMRALQVSGSDTSAATISSGSSRTLSTDVVSVLESPISTSETSGSKFTPGPKSPAGNQSAKHVSKPVPDPVKSKRIRRPGTAPVTRPPLHDAFRSYSVDDASSREQLSTAGRLPTVRSMSGDDSLSLPPINEGLTTFADDIFSQLGIPQPSASSSQSTRNVAEQTRPSLVRHNTPPYGGSERRGSSLRSPISIRSTDKEGPYIKCREDGTVKAGNLSGLVRHLVQGSGDEKDRRFREVFLASYPAFAEDNTELWYLLYEQYDTVSSPLHNAEQRTGVRRSVLIVLDQWLQMNPMRSEDLSLLYQMRDLAQSIQSPTSHKNSALKIMELIDKTTKSLRTPPLVSSLSTYKVGTVPKPPEVSPAEFAAAFTDLETRKFVNITAADCTRWLNDEASPNGVTHLISENKKISHWIQNYVLFLPRHSQRSENLKYFFRVAEECRKLRNFSTTHAILAGITSPSIAGLKRTSSLDRQTQRKLREYKDLMSQNNDYRAYRRELSKSKAPCIPLLSVHMEDLKLIHGKEPSFMKQEGHRDVMNFGLYERVYDGSRNVLDYQRGQIGLSISPRHSEIRKFIEDGLGAFVVGEAFDKWLQHRSAKLFREEQASYTSYDEELELSGFR